MQLRHIIFMTTFLSFPFLQPDIHAAETGDAIASTDTREQLMTALRLAKDKKYDEEMLDKLDKFGYHGYVYLPVVDIEGKMFVKANIKEVYTEAVSK